MKGLAKAMAGAALLALLGAGSALAHIDVPGLDENGQCIGDADGNNEVQINELILAVNNALHGCARLPITLNFRGVVGEQPFACANVYQGIGTAASRFIPSDFRFYLSGFKLITVGGDEVPLELDQSSLWQYHDVAMIDFETGPDDGCGEGNRVTNTVVTGSVPAGIYTGLQFDLGLPFDLNHGDASVAPAPLNFSAMFWTWNDGYKFFRLDTLDGNFRIHLGSTGCNGASATQPPTSCDRPNVSTVTLNGFNISHSIIEADLAALLADNNIDTNQPGSSLGCMSDPDDQDCAPVFRNLGLSFPAGTSTGNTQKLFRLETEHETAHKEIKVAGSAEAGGMLRSHTEFDLNDALALSFDNCFGGSDAACTGGMRLFSAANPGIVPLDASEPGESLFTLADGVPITLEVVALDDGLTIHYGDVVLDSAGDSVLLGQTPSFHADLETQLLIPGGTPTRTYSASFKLTTTSSAYTASDVFTVKFTPTEPSS